jgi:DNA-binding NtrC family response regulator
VRDASPLGVRLGAAVWLELPPLSRRRDELPRILADAAAEAARELERPLAALRTGDVEQLADEPFEGLAGVHDAARRLVALRALGTSAGAAHLGVAPGALSRWARRRGLAA